MISLLIGDEVRQLFHDQDESMIEADPLASLALLLAGAAYLGRSPEDNISRMRTKSGVVASLLALAMCCSFVSGKFITRFFGLLIGC